jgi:hypothetical protein
MGLIAVAVLLVVVSLDHIATAQTRIRDMDIAGVKLGMNKNTALRAAQGSGFGNTRDSGNFVVMKKSAVGSGPEHDLIIGLTPSGKVHRVRMNIIPKRVKGYEQLVNDHDQMVEASRRYYLELLKKYGTPQEGGADSQEAVYQESEERGVPTLILDYTTVAGIALEWPALLEEEKARANPRHR